VKGALCELRPSSFRCAAASRDRFVLFGPGGVALLGGRGPVRLLTTKLGGQKPSFPLLGHRAGDRSENPPKRFLDATSGTAFARVTAGFLRATELAFRWNSGGVVSSVWIASRAGEGEFLFFLRYTSRFPALIPRSVMILAGSDEAARFRPEFSLAPFFSSCS